MATAGLTALVLAKLEEMKLIDFDFAKYGSSAERKRLLARWDADVRNAPKQ